MGVFDFCPIRMENLPGCCDILEQHGTTRPHPRGTFPNSHLPLLNIVFPQICVYGFTYSAPTIIHELGYTASEAQLLTVPIYFLCVCSTILFSRLSDKSQSRWLWIVVPYFIALVGLIGLLSIPHPRLPGLTYAFLFCIPAGVYPPLIGAVSWIGNNLAPSWKRVIGMALFMSIGNLVSELHNLHHREKEKEKQTDLA